MTESIVIDNVWKRYLLGETPNIATLAKNLLLSRRRQPLWALGGVSLRINKGETVGLVGLNGSGKTTLLRTLARVTVPTKGEVRTQGRVAALIALGAGFHLELTGRDNIYLNGAILGMRKKELDRKFDSIVEFAELGKFIDTPVKRYSSGMRVRLGFAIAAHVEPDILLVDEVLSVGDVAFRRKSVNRMLQFKEQGSTIIFVSHNMVGIEMMCDRTIWLHKGKVRADGDTSSVIREYMDFTAALVSNASMEEARKLDMGSGEIMVERITLHDEYGVERTDFAFGEVMRVKIHYKANVHVTDPMFHVLIRSADLSIPVIMADMRNDGIFTGDLLEGKGVVECTFPDLPLTPASYEINVGIKLNYLSTPFNAKAHATFRIRGSAAELGFHGEIAESNLREVAPVIVPYKWSLDNDQKAVVLGQVEPKKLNSDSQNVAD